MKNLIIIIFLTLSSFGDVIVPIEHFLNDVDIVLKGEIIKCEIIEKNCKEKKDSVNKNLDTEYLIAVQEKYGFNDSLKDMFISKIGIDSSAIQRITIKISNCYKCAGEKGRTELIQNVDRKAYLNHNSVDVVISDWTKLKKGDKGIFLAIKTKDGIFFRGMIPHDNNECVDMINLFFKDKEQYNKKNEKWKCNQKDLIF